MFTCMSFGSFAAISLFSTCSHTTQYQACLNLFYTLNVNKDLIILLKYADILWNRTLVLLEDKLVTQ